MTELSFTIAENWPEGTRYLREQFVVNGFADTIELRPTTWENLFSELKTAAFKKQGLEISEIGSTWLSSLVGMKTIRPFTQDEVANIGGAHTFIQPLWSSAFVTGDRRVWSIPWLGDTRVIFYWRDMLEDAAIDPATAFRTPDQFEATLQQLQSSGVPYPWSVPTTMHLNTLHQIATWIWGAGGDFLGPEGKSVAFHQPEAIQGMAQYFRLYRYLDPQAESGIAINVFTPFMERKTAITMSGPWDWIQSVGSLDADMAAQVGVALPPGPTFAGSANVVIADHTPIRQERTAVEMIRLLIDPTIQAEYCRRVGMLPVRVDALNEPPYSTDPALKIFMEALVTGRSIPNVPLWGVFEERLGEAFGLIWGDIKANPKASVHTILNDHLQPLAKRLNRMLTQLG
jgi:multiple sugar transport system substrate-binding protein